MPANRERGDHGTENASSCNGSNGDPSAPVAFYARGPRWRGDEARRISRDRVALARRLLAQEDSR